MKRFKVIYNKYGTNETAEIFVNAESEKDARDYFFTFYHGILLRIEFVEYV